MRWEREAWVKLYRREVGSFALLPLYARALAGELLKFADDDGRLYVGKREAWEAIAKLCGATAGDRRMLRAHIPMLIEDGYLVLEGEHLVIRNMPDAQAKPRRQVDALDVPPPPATPPTDAAADGARTGTNHAPTNSEPARTVSEPGTNQRELETKNESSARNHSDVALTGACASERSEEIRRDSEHTQAASAEATDPKLALVAALRAHPVLLDSARSTPLGETSAISNLADTVLGAHVTGSKPIQWIVQAIADAARDLAAEASGAGRLTWTAVATKVARYADRAKAPSGPATGPSRATGAPTLPPGEDERWTAATWQQARTDRNYPDGEPDPRRIAALWTAACKASMGAKPVDKWKPGPRDIVTHWIRTYLDTPQTRAGGDADQGYPLAFLASRATSGEGVTLPTKADVQRPVAGVPAYTPEDFAPPPPRPPVDHAALKALTASLSSLPGANSDDAAPPVRRPARMS